MPALSACVRWLAIAIACALAGTTAFAQQPAVSDPPARGDRVWTDDGARAEVHFGPSVLHMDSRTFVELLAIDADVVQIQLNEGSANARVRELQGDDIFEIDTPNLAFRATQPGDWRIDVDAQGGFTRIALRSGAAVVYGAGGGVRALTAGQVLAFTGRDLLAMQNPPPIAAEGFDRWAGERNGAEDQSTAARHLPRDVVGYNEIDRNGSWSQDPYVRNANRYVVTDSRAYSRGLPRFLRSDAVTAMRVDDFQGARPVHQHWTRVNPSDLARAQPLTAPAQRYAQPIAPATPRMSPTTKRPHGAGARPGNPGQLN